MDRAVSQGEKRTPCRRSLAQGEVVETTGKSVRFNTIYLYFKIPLQNQEALGICGWSKGDL